MEQKNYPTAGIWHDCKSRTFFLFRSDNLTAYSYLFVLLHEECKTGTERQYRQSLLGCCHYGILTPLARKPSCDGISHKWIYRERKEMQIQVFMLICGDWYTSHLNSPTADEWIFTTPLPRRHSESDTGFVCILPGYNLQGESRICKCDTTDCKDGIN